MLRVVAGCSSSIRARSQNATPMPAPMPIRSASEAVGNVVRFRLERYLEALESDATDAHSRLAATSGIRADAEHPDVGLVRCERRVVVFDPTLELERRGPEDVVVLEREQDVGDPSARGDVPDLPQVVLPRVLRPRELAVGGHRDLAGPLVLVRPSLAHLDTHGRQG